MFKPLSRWALFFALVTTHAMGAEREIYFTDFEAAPVGNNNLIGFDGWVTLGDNDRGAHGIDAAAVEGLGQSAFIGSNSPGFGTTSVSVLRSSSHDPIATGEPIIRLVAVVGINDSVTNPNRDLFFVGFVNSNGKTLASLTFNNTEAAFGLWRDDLSGTSHDTGEEFIRGEAQLLVAEVDTANNTWTVELDGFPVFRDEEFTTLDNEPIDLLFTAVTWQRGGGFNWGNNWMLFDDWSVNVDTHKAVIPQNPFKVTSVTRDSADCALLTWKAQPGFTYQVEYSDNMATWRADLPGSTKTEPVEQDTTYTDLTSPGIPNRAYRVVRTES